MRTEYTRNVSEMTRGHHKSSRIRLYCRGSVCALAVAVSLVSACSRPEDGPDDVAVANMPTSQIESTSFLSLNDDKPGTWVTVTRYLAKGKYTIVHYFSSYDGASPSLLPRLAQLTQSRNDIAVRTVNVNRPEVQGIDWESPVMVKLGIEKLPFFQIYDPAMRLRAQARPAHQQVMQWLQALPSY